MNRLHTLLKSADFTRETDLKERLAHHLFDATSHEIDDSDLTLLAAAGTLDQDAKNRTMIPSKTAQDGKVEIYE